MQMCLCIDTMCADIFISEGCLYKNGEGTPKDEDKALKYFLLAAHQGHIEAFHVQLLFTRIDSMRKDQSTYTIM